MNSERRTERKMMMRPTGTIIAPPTPCTKRATVNVASESDAAHSSEPDDEHADGGAEDGAGAEAVGDPAADRDEHAEAEHVARDRDFQRDGVAAEGARHFGNRGDDDVRIDAFHEHRARDDERGDESFDGERHGESMNIAAGGSGDYGIDMEQPLRDGPQYATPIGDTAPLTDNEDERRWTRKICSASSRRRCPMESTRNGFIADLPGHYLAWFAREGFPQGQLGRLLALMHEIDHNNLRSLLEPLRAR